MLIAACHICEDLCGRQRHETILYIICFDAPIPSKKTSTNTQQVLSSLSGKSGAVMLSTNRRFGHLFESFSSFLPSLAQNLISAHVFGLILILAASCIFYTHFDVFTSTFVELTCSVVEQRRVRASEHQMELQRSESHSQRTTRVRNAQVDCFCY